MTCTGYNRTTIMGAHIQKPHECSVVILALTISNEMITLDVESRWNKWGLHNISFPIKINVPVKHAKRVIELVAGLHRCCCSFAPFPAILVPMCAACLSQPLTIYKASCTLKRMLTSTADCAPSVELLTCMECTGMATSRKPHRSSAHFTALMCLTM